MTGTRRAQLEALLALLGIYAIHFVLTRAAVATMPSLAVIKPLGGLWLFTGWDAEHYLRLAHSYDSYAWPPLYPMVLRAVSCLGLTVEAAAAVVNLAAHAAIMLLAAELVRSNPRLNAVPGWLFGALLIFFPFHNVFFAAYSESLFVALMLGACVAYQRECFGLAGVLCGLSLLTRNMGVFLGGGLLVVEVARAVERRRFDPTRVASVALWVPVYLGWVAWLKFVAATDPVSATGAWQVELLEHHVPVGESPKWWVFRFIAFPPANHFEWVAFWGLVVAAVWSWFKRLRVEAMTIVLFLSSFALYLYRPFPFTRYASSLFPLALMAAWFLRRRPLMQVVVVGVCIAMSHWFEVMLFSDRFGEP